MGFSLRSLSTLALVGALAALLAGCGPARTPDTGPRAATLEVVNRTPRPQEIFLDGQRIARVPSGERRRVRTLPARSVHLRAQPVDGGLSAEREGALGTERPFEWVLSAGDATLPEPPRLGDLEIVNALGRDLELSLDGRRLGALFAGERRVFPDLVAGARVAEARSPSDGRMVRTSVDVRPDETTRWTVRAPMGTLIVRNGWSESAEVTVDGRIEGRVEAGGTLEVPDRFVGSLLAEARGLRSGTSTRTDLAVAEGARVEWHLTEGTGGVTVDNHADEPLTVLVDGTERGVVAPLEALAVDALATGPHRLEVVGRESGLRLVRELRLGSGERARWRVDPRFGAVRVRNTSLEAQLVYLDGAFRRELAPGEAADLRDVPAGPHALSAVGLRSRVRQDHALHALPEAGASWRIVGAAGSLVVDNRREEALRLYVDAELRGIVQAGQAMAVEPVVVGDRLLEAVGQETGRVFRARWPVDAATARRWVVRDPAGTLVVHNGSGEALRTGPRLAGQVPRVLAGERFPFRLTPGEQRVVLVGVETGFQYALETVIADEGEVTWSVGRPRGTLVVHDRAGEALRVSLDGAPVRIVPAGEDLVLENVPAGRHVVHAEGERSGAVMSWSVALAPDGRAAWEVQPQLARVRVRNTTDEALLVSVDDTPFGRIEPDAVLQLGGLVPGAHGLTARGERSGVRHATQLEAHLARTAVWEILPARGTVVITSEESGALDVALDGEPVGTVDGPGSPLVLDAATGLRTLAADGRDDARRFRATLRVRPDRTADVTVPPATARLVVVNGTAQPVRVLLGDRLLGTAPAGKPLLVDDLPPTGRLELRARSEDGRAAWSRALWSTPDRAAEIPVWELRPVLAD